MSDFDKGKDFDLSKVKDPRDSIMFADFELGEIVVFRSVDRALEDMGIDREEITEEFEDEALINQANMLQGRQAIIEAISLSDALKRLIYAIRFECPSCHKLTCPSGQIIMVTKEFIKRKGKPDDRAHLTWEGLKENIGWKPDED